VVENLLVVCAGVSVILGLDTNERANFVDALEGELVTGLVEVSDNVPDHGLVTIDTTCLLDATALLTVPSQSGLWHPHVSAELVDTLPPVNLAITKAVGALLDVGQDGALCGSNHGSGEDALHAGSLFGVGASAFLHTAQSSVCVALVIHGISSGHKGSVGARRAALGLGGPLASLALTLSLIALSAFIYTFVLDLSPAQLRLGILLHIGTWVIDLSTNVQHAVGVEGTVQRIVTRTLSGHGVLVLVLHLTTSLDRVTGQSIEVVQGVDGSGWRGYVCGRDGATVLGPAVAVVVGVKVLSPDIIGRFAGDVADDGGDIQLVAGDKLFVGIAIELVVAIVFLANATGVVTLDGITELVVATSNLREFSLQFAVVSCHICLKCSHSIGIFAVGYVNLVYFVIQSSIYRLGSALFIASAPQLALVRSLIQILVYVT